MGEGGFGALHTSHGIVGLALFLGVVAQVWCHIINVMKSKYHKLVP
jgi:hypothetical protein